MIRTIQSILGEAPSHESAIMWYFHCPFHQDKHASLAVYKDQARGWFCYQCRKGGSIAKLLIDVGRWDVGEALSFTNTGRFTWLKNQPAMHKVPPLPPAQGWQEWAGVETAKAMARLSTKEASRSRHELIQRKICPAVLHRYCIGYVAHREEFEKPETKLLSGLLFPAMRESVVWSINIRTGHNSPKYFRPPGGSRSVPFGIEQIQFLDKLVVVEGELDALTASSALQDKADVLALRGVANFRIRAWNWVFLAYKQVIVCLDGDEPGQMAAGLLLRQYPMWENRCPPEATNDLGKMAKAGISLAEIAEFLESGLC